MSETAKERADTRPLITRVAPSNLLSYGPDFTGINLHSLNVLIGPNGSGKSNLIELFQLYKAVPSDLVDAVRRSGSINELIWKGASQGKPRLYVQVVLPYLGRIGHAIELKAVRERYEIESELVLHLGKFMPNDNAYIIEKLIYKNEGGRIDLEGRELDPNALDRQQSILAQRKDPESYPEITALGAHARNISIYREWAVGPYAPIRSPQPADLPNDVLLPDVRNLGMILNAMSVERGEAWDRLNEGLRRFLPRFKALSTYVAAGTVQIFLHEEGLQAPIAATRISDGTMRFIALLAILLRPEHTSLICLEEPELGLHPDALRIVADALVWAAERTQVVVTTQSDALVSALTEATESVIVCDYAGGSTRMRRLEAEKLKFWLENYQLGEIWRMGELGGNP